METMRLCNQTHPYFDSRYCMNCDLPKIFDLDTFLCIDVPANKVFNPNIHKLVDKSDIKYNSYPNNTFVLTKNASSLPS
jgi:hypothetical protein